MTTAPAVSCMSTEHGCVMFDCLVHIWEWLDPPVPQTEFQMDNKKPAPATQQPLTQQHIMAHHVHPEQIYSQQHTQTPAHLTSAQTGQIQPNGVMHQLLQSQYHSNMNARSPLLENRHELYGTGYNHDYVRHYGANDNYNPQAPIRVERTEMHTDHNVNHELLYNVPKGYNAEVYQDYLKRNPPKDTNQIYQNHQPTYRPNINQYGSKPYLPYSNRIGPQSNTELLRRQYNEIQQMKLQQQLHYQNQAQMHQQQKFAERQLLLQQMHGIQPPPNFQNSIYSDGSYRDIDRYSSKNDFKDYSSPESQKDIYSRNDPQENETQNRQYQEAQWQTNQESNLRELELQKILPEKNTKKDQYREYNNQSQKTSFGVNSPIKSSESSTPSVKSPSSEGRRSSGGTQALRSPTAQRIPSAPVTMSGILYKQGSDGLRVWRKRWFVLSEFCLFYYKSQDEEKLLGSVLLPSYKVSACTVEDKVLRKFSFKLEHANMRTYILAAPDQESMMKWVKVLTMAALMQNPNDQRQSQNERTAAKTEDGDEIPMYVNAPPKPRRSNEGYNSPSPEMYDPNYDLLKKPSSHYNQDQTNTTYSDHMNYPNSPNQESPYTPSPQSPPPQQKGYQKRLYNTHNLSLPLNNAHDKPDINQPSVSGMRVSNSQSPYFDRTIIQHHQALQENDQELYEHQTQRNPFLQNTHPQLDNPPKELDLQNKSSRRRQEQDRGQVLQTSYPDSRMTHKPMDYDNVDVYGESNIKPVRNINANDRLIDRRTPDTYGRSTTMSSYNKDQVGECEDVYGTYGDENEYGKTYAQSQTTSQSRDNISISSYQQQKNLTATYNQEKIFSGPSVLRRKKMQSSGIQPPVPRPHSADFLEYETKNETLNKSIPNRGGNDLPRQPQRPKSSLDINSPYDPSSDKYYSEESYAEKMRQSAQYLQQGLAPRNMEIPLAKYASGLAQKQLSSAYSQITNNNYETEFSTNRANRDNVSYNSKCDIEGLNSNWTLKEKITENQKDFLNRSGSVMSDGSNASGFVKDTNRIDPNSDGFMRSASARLPTAVEKNGEKKVQQREESMKRLLEWKQRMLQSPLTRKSTPATISLARSLNQNRQSLRSDQYKSKTYANTSYNSYSSDDEEESSGTEQQRSREMQAGRSHIMNPMNINVLKPITPHALCLSPITDQHKNHIKDETDPSENTYENIFCTITMPKINLESDYEDSFSKGDDLENLENKKAEDTHEDGYETHESEAESETHVEYTDNDLDEVLLEPEIESHGSIESDKECTHALSEEKSKIEIQVTPEVNTVSTPPAGVLGENHYLPMSPRKMSTIEIAHKNILQSLCVQNPSLPQNYEDNPYVEMNINNVEEDSQTYELVCVNNGKAEPVYMELNNVTETELKSDNTSLNSRLSLDAASNFADTKEQTLKRASKTDKVNKEKYDCSDADDEASKDISLETPFSRFSISDTFRPASYYLSSSSNIIDTLDSSDSEITSPPPIPSSSPPCDDLTDEALSKYILDKLDQSDMSHDNSILKMLTSENQKMNTVKKKTTSLMICESPTSIHDTLSRGEKVRNSRVSLTNERKKIISETSLSFLNNNEGYNHFTSVDTDSMRSDNADRGSSRLSLESDVSSKFDMSASNVSSDVTSLNESDVIIDFRHSAGYRDLEMMIKRRPLSDDSFFDLVDSEFAVHSASTTNIDLDSYLDNLQPTISNREINTIQSDIQLNTPVVAVPYSNGAPVEVSKNTHIRSSSTPVSHGNKLNSAGNRYSAETQFSNISEQVSGYRGSQNSCSSASGIPKSQISYYCKSYDEEKLLTKNLNQDGLADKIKEFENVKLALRTGNDTHTSSTSTGFHSRESSTEHSAPYYYSDLSSQEHINILPTSHYLKNTNLHRKLNNQRRRGPLHKKNDISHIQNPIKNNQVMISEQPFDFAESARCVSVEFLSAAVKDPEIDTKNIYESSGGKKSKISDSMNLISGLGCKRNWNNNCNIENTSADGNDTNVDTLTKLSSTSMSSHCSENSSNTVYYDAEADTNTYENVTCHGEKHWDEDALWRDNLRRVSHRNARSMDNLDTVVTEASTTNRLQGTIYEMNSIKRLKKDTAKIRRNVTYVNCDLQGRVHRNGDNRLGTEYNPGKITSNENDVYVRLTEDGETHLEQSDEGVYEQLSLNSSNVSTTHLTNIIANNYGDINKQAKKKFEIDREKLRQWDLMSSGLIKESRIRVRGLSESDGVGEATCNTDTGTDSASNEASMTIQGNNIDSVTNNNSTNQQVLSKKAFLGSNTSIGRNNRDVNIPVRAVSPRVRWVEEKINNDHYGSQQISTSQQNLNALTGVEDSWAVTRSPSRNLQQPISAVSPRVRRNNENEELLRVTQRQGQQYEQIVDIPTAGELLGRTHEELVLLLIQLRRRHAATHRAIEHCCIQINSIEDCINSLKAMEREESLKRLEKLKNQLMELEHQYEKSKPLVQLVDNMVKLGSLYNRPGSTIERLERNQRLRQKVLAEHALEQQRWLESVAAGKSLETEAARARVAELWALEQELADEAAILQGLKTDKDTIENLLSGVRGKADSVHKHDLHNTSVGQIGLSSNSTTGGNLEAELARVHVMLAHNSKKLEQTVADNARLERELQQLRRALQARRAAAPAHPTAMLEDEVCRVQQLVTALQRQRQELSRAVRHLTQQSHALQNTHDSMPGKRRPLSSWQETNLDTGHTIDHGNTEYDCEPLPLVPPGHYERTSVEVPLYVDTRPVIDVTSPLNSEDIQHGAFGNLSNVEKQEIKTVRIVKRESERRQRDRERSLQPMSDWPSNNITANLDQFLEEELVQSTNYTRAASLPRTDYKYENYYTKIQQDHSNYPRVNEKNMELSPKYVSSPSLSNYDYSREISSTSSSYNKSYDKSGYDRTISVSNQYLNSPTDSSRTLTNDPMSKTSSIVSLTRSNMELSPIFKSEAAKQIITEMSGDNTKNGSLHRRQVPKEKRRHYTAPHHLSTKTLNEIPKDSYNQDKLGRSLDDADMERALRGAPAPDVVRSALPPQALRLADNTIDQLLAAPQKIVIPERYIPEKPPELSPEEQQKRLEKVESIKKMLSGSSADPTKSPDGDDKRQREHLLQMNQILAKQVTEMSKIIAVKALEELPQNVNADEFDDNSPDVELPIYQQRDNFFT